MGKRKILVSISGGRTSAMMAALIKKLYGVTCEIIYVFSNTTREEEASLVFLDKVDKLFNLGVVWIEAVVHHGSRKSCTHKVVNFQTACRDGSVFEEVIKKYGIPNTKFKHCTRELKTNPIKSYAKAVFGKYGKDYETAIGYRADEPKRINPEKIKTQKHLYILNDAGIKKADVAYFWSQQPFDLEISDYEGNCKLCLKKSKRKLLTTIVEKPEHTEWISNMEKKYEQVKPKKKQHDKTPTRFFREGDSIHDLIEESKFPFDKAVDRSRDITGYNAAVQFQADMDYEDADCGSSCEPFT